MRSPTTEAARAELDRVVLLTLFARLDTFAMAAALGAVGACIMALATAVLLVVGAPPDSPVGPNLAALGTFLPGYGVSWGGAVAGGAYGAAIGAVGGFSLATFWNFAHLVFLGLVALRAQRF